MPEIRRRGDGLGQAPRREAVTAEQLRERCQERITGYKIPRHWKFVDSFPMTVTGKVQKYKMRETATAEMTQESSHG